MKTKYKILEKFKNFLSTNIYFDKDLYEKNKINYLDIGSIGELKWPASSIKKEFINIIKFDAQYNENQTKNLDKFNSILWSSEVEKEFYFNTGNQTSSLFKPNYKILNYYPDIERFDIDYSKKIKTTTLDRVLPNNTICDFLKLDVQGSELEILKGVEEKLKDELVGLEIEIHFTEIYKEQPLFSEVDTYIRNKYKLNVWDLNSQYFLFKNISKNNFNNKGRLMWADALYLRSVENIDEWIMKFDEEKAKQKILSLIGVSISYGYFDYVYTLLNKKSITNYFSKNELNKLNIMLKKNATLFKFKPLNNIFFFIFSLISNMFNPIYKNFSYGNSTLGTRKFLKYFFKQ